MQEVQVQACVCAEVQAEEVCRCERCGTDMMRCADARAPLMILRFITLPPRHALMLLFFDKCRRRYARLPYAARAASAPRRHAAAMPPLPSPPSATL